MREIEHVESVALALSKLENVMHFTFSIPFISQVPKSPFLFSPGRENTRARAKAEQGRTQISSLLYVQNEYKGHFFDGREKKNAVFSATG